MDGKHKYMWAIIGTLLNLYVGLNSCEGGWVNYDSWNVEDHDVLVYSLGAGQKKLIWTPCDENSEWHWKGSIMATCWKVELEGLSSYVKYRGDGIWIIGKMECDECYGWCWNVIDCEGLCGSDRWNLTEIKVRYVSSVENQPPVASFKSLNVIELGHLDEKTFDGGHMVGGVIRFDPTASYDSDGEIIKYEWDFDNGKKFSTNEPNVYDVTFEEARIYNVTLTVTDNDGLTNTFVEPLDLTLKDGDLIFIRTAWWDIPFNIVGNEYTHVGMYVGGQWMIESILTENNRSSGFAGVVQSPLSGWSYPSETFATLVRVKTANDKTRQKSVVFAQSKLGQRYDLKVWKKSVNQPNYYCSELIWAAYYKASKGKIDLGNKGKKGGVWPDDIINDAVNTKVIGYHWEHNPL